MKKVSVVLPAKNEQGNIGNLIKEIHQALTELCPYEIVLTNDNSSDNTAQEAIESAEQFDVPLRIISHPVSCGQSTAIYNAIHYAQGDWIITSDADGQNNPADYASLLTLAQQQPESTHFCIAGHRHQRLDTAWVRFQSKIANRIRQAILGDGVPDSGCGLKLFPKPTFLLLPYFDHMHRFIPALVKRLGGEIIVCPVSHRDRVAGTSNYNSFNLLIADLVDLLGLLWLKKRSNYSPTIAIQYDSIENEPK